MVVSSTLGHGICWPRIWERAKIVIDRERPLYRALPFHRNAAFCLIYDSRGLPLFPRKARESSTGLETRNKPVVEGLGKLPYGRSP